MSQSPRPLLAVPSSLSVSPSHSRALLAISGCRRGLPPTSPSAHSRRKATHCGSDSLKKKCSDDFITGVAPVRVEYGSSRSVGAYTALHTSQESPYWSLAPHFGHSPLM